jgi:hypothetical protein
MDMKRLIFKISALCLCLGGCAGFDDMNKNPYAMYDSESQAQVQTILYNTEYALVGSAQTLIAELMQYTVNTDTEITANMIYNYSISESAAVRIWQRLYVQAGNVEYMLAKARENMKILHPLPRVNEIEYSIDDTPYAYYFQQAQNGLYARQALICDVLGITLEDVINDKTIL